jgi:nitroreductase
MSPPGDLHPLLASRWSPAQFDRDHELTRDHVDLLLEAARWAPSAGNSQPWAFIVGLRGDPIHARLCRHLSRSSARWAPSAGALVANLSHGLVEDTDWEFSEFAQYDLGQAVAHLTVQAHALGLHVRQFRAFDRTALHAEFAIPPHWEVTTLAAVGVPAGPEPSAAGRERRPVDDLLWVPLADGLMGDADR